MKKLTPEKIIREMESAFMFDEIERQKIIDAFKKMVSGNYLHARSLLEAYGRHAFMVAQKYYIFRLQKQYRKDV